MKISILPVRDIFKPKSQPFIYPKHNKDYGVEQDFYEYFQKEQSLHAQSGEKADWFYLPIFWTRWHLNNDYAKKGLKALQVEVDRVLNKASKTFTVCQYDDGPVVGLGKTKVFYASRKIANGQDIPLLASPHKIPWLNPRKKYLAVFSGRIMTHSIRKEMIDRCGEDKQFLIRNSDASTKSYVKDLLSAYVALCPRGYGGSSFRFYEAMQLGVVPFLIGDIDTRPFKNQIDWNQISFYSKESKDIKKIINTIPKDQLLVMGKKAKQVFETKLKFGVWPKQLLKELI